MSVQIVARGIAMMFSIVTVSLTARALDPDGFGVWTAAGAFVGIFASFTDFGLTTVAMQKMAAEPDREPEWLGALAGARLVAAFLAMTLCGALVPIFLDETTDGMLVGWVMTLTILTGAAGAITAVFQSRLRSGLTLSFPLLHSFLWTLAVVALWWTEAGVVTFAIAYVLVIGVVAILQIAVTHRYASVAWRAGVRLWRPMARTALPLGVAGVLIVVYYEVDAILLLKIAGPEETGIYGAAYRFLAPLIFLPAAVMSSFFPVLSAIRDSDTERMRRLVQIAADYMAVLSLPILAGAVALSGPVIQLLYGDAFEESAAVLPILMVAFVSICYGTLAGFLAPLLDLHWRLAIYSGLGVLGNIGLNLYLIPRHGALGAAWSTVGTEGLTMTLMLTTALVRLKLSFRPWRILRVVAVAAVATAAMKLAAPLGLVPAGLLGAVIYAGGLLALRVVLPSELRALRR